MGLFDQITNAIANPNQQASSAGLGDILGTIQQMSGNDSGTNQAVVSMVSGYVRSALQEKREEGGADMVTSLVNQFSGTSPNPNAVTALFSESKLGEMVSAVAEKTGLNFDTIQMMLPMAIPSILSLLKTGASNDNPDGSDNPVLSSFLDADGDGDLDIADAMNLAQRFLG